MDSERLIDALFTVLELVRENQNLREELEMTESDLNARMEELKKQRGETCAWTREN